MATLEKPKQKKNKQSVPSKSSKSKIVNNVEKSITINNLEKEVEVVASSSTVFQKSDELSKNETNSIECEKVGCTETKENEICTETDTNCDIKSDEPFTNIKVLDNAPVLSIDHIKLDIVTYPELPKTELTRLVEVDRTEIKKEIIKPFSTTQLAALYNNPELNASKQFVLQFIDSELGAVNANQHPLYDLLMSYLHAREKLQEISIELNQLKSEYKSCQDQLWVLESATVNGKGQCQDGNNVVVAHEFKIAKFQKNLLDNLIRLQSKIKVLANEQYTLYSYTTCLLKLKVDHYISTVIHNCQESLGLQSSRSDAPATLRNEIASSGVHPCLRELRLCVSVLFAFQRRLHKDREFLTETRSWLSDVVGLLLRVADWQDHHYLLNQVLRCPAGIGSWAVNYIQVPVSDVSDVPFSNRHINHVVAVLSILLCPVEKRDEFLKQILATLNEPQDVAAENLWVLVDSDGEEDEDNNYGISALKENDLVALLNQIPIAELFRNVLLIHRQDMQDVWGGGGDDHHVLRLFSFCTVFVQLLEQGLATYNSSRYHQFAKRLCRLIRHTLQYASDTWEAHRSSSTVHTDKAMFERLQIEFDAFFLRATSCLFRAQNLGAWQFLAVAPFHTVSIWTLWKFFYMLHQNENDCIQNSEENIDYKNKLSELSARQQFCERLCVMSVEESYYLLNTFANMIMARSVSDEEFIKFATLNLLQIGFSGDAESQESCCKCAGILLSNITNRYPVLISDILSLMRNNISELNQIMFLFSELPLHLWRPMEKDIDIITLWLLQNQIVSIESSVARKILSNLNWNFASTNELFLPLSLHRRVALLVLETVERHAPGADTCGFLDGVKQAVGHQMTAEQLLVKWAWKLVYQLRLHATARSTYSVQGIPELVDVDMVQRCTRDRQPLACYIALAMTAVGHLLPLVCSQGLTLLETLTACYKYDAVLIALHDIIPLFIDSAETLIMCTSFQAILSNLLSADRTYMKVAKSLISTEFPGTVVRQFANMIESHIHNPHWHPLMEFWTKTLVSVTNWNKDPGILYLLNVIIRTAFFIPEIYQAVCNVFNELLEKIRDRTNGSNSLLSWVPLVGGGSSTGSALLLGPNVISETWLTYLIITLEHHHVELHTGLWPELLRQLYANTGKTNVDAALKKAANIVKVPTYTSNGLCLYRLAQLALETPLDHPLLPLIWQKFFCLYLARVPAEPRAENRGSVGSKFFDGMVNTSFCKKLKKRLQETVEFSKKKLNPPEEESNEYQLRPSQNKELEHRRLAIFNAYVLWLEEPLLQETTLYLPSLPPQYEPRYLKHIIQGSTSPWIEFIDCEYILNEYEQSKVEWDTLSNKTVKVNRQVMQKMGGGEVRDPVERILRRLSSYDKPLPPPQLKQISFLLPVISFQPGDSVSYTLLPHIKKLQQFAEIYNLQVSEHGALDCQYKELIQQLYNSFQSKVTCKRTCKPTCSGAATITITFCEARVNETVKHQMQTNRTNFSTLLTRTLQPPVQLMTLNCASLEYSAEILHKRLLDCLRQGDSATDKQIRSIGVDFFYYLLSTYNEELKAYPPTQQLFNNCFEKLGQTFLCGIENETVRLVKTILQQPQKGYLLAPHFSAQNLTTDTLLQLYSEISDKINNVPEVTFTLLSKFNIQSWLSNKKPRLVDRSKFIQLLFQSLTRLGSKPTKQQYSLHEVYRNHLLTVFRYDFPEHYGEVLMLVLQHSAAQTLAVNVWTDLLNALTFPASIQLLEENESSSLKEKLRTHATRQQMLGTRDLAETVALLSRYFIQERLQFGLYGLYPKYRVYIEPISLLIGMTLHALVVSTVVQHGSTLADALFAEHLWPRIVDAFAPWLQPYSVHDCKDSTATWIKQLTDDRAVLLPWIQADIASAKKFLNMFITCIIFIGDTLPACTNLMSYVWQFYSTNFAHATVKEHVWIVVHDSLSTLFWEQFWPSLSDLEMMLKIVDQYLPECHAFLGRIFLEVNWPLWLARLVQSRDSAAISRAHHCLLHLLVKLSREPTVRQSESARILLERAQDFAWSSLDVVSVENVLDWYVMSSDPRVALPPDPSVKQIDYIVFGLLRVVSNYEAMKQTTDLEIFKKRQCFIRAYIKLLINCSSRHKNLLISKPQYFHNALSNQLDHLEHILSTENEGATNQDLLVSELLLVLNNAALNTVALKCFEQWLESRSASSQVLQGILRICALSVSSIESIGALLEGALEAYFTLNTSQAITWTNAVALLEIGPRQPQLEKALVGTGRVLSLHALLLKSVAISEDRNSFETLLETVISWLTSLKPNNLVESKLPLLWIQVIRLALKLCHEGGENKAAAHLRKFTHDHLLFIAENRSGSASGWSRGILGAIGLNRQGSLSPQCRFLCRAVGGYLLAQLPEPRGEPSKVRCFAGASGPVGQPGGNAECAKVLLKLDAGVSELKPHVENALRQIQDPQNSLHNAESFLIGLIDILYSKAYLKIC